MLALGACETGPDDLDDEQALLELEDESLEDELPAQGTTSGGELEIFDYGPFDEDDEDDEDPELPGSDELATDIEPQQIGVVSYWSWGTYGQSGPKLDMGDASDRTCFLIGVTGDLEGQWKGPLAGVWVDIDTDNHWKMYTRSGVGTGLMGHAACIPATYNREFIYWSGTSENNPWNTTVYPQQGPRGLFTQCFLTSVTGTDGWKSPNSWAGVQRQDIYENGQMVPKWTLKGGLLWEQDNTAGGSAAAVCIDLWQSVWAWSHQPALGAGWTYGDFGTATDRTCGLQKLKGNFAAAPNGWWEGLRLYLSGGKWKVVGINGKQGWGDCLKNPVFPGWP